jgi:hypothetical protein
VLEVQLKFDEAGDPVDEKTIKQWENTNFDFNDLNDLTYEQFDRESKRPVRAAFIK